MGATDQDWAKAFALQALSDLEARDILDAGNADKCHKLHFLQMAAEKICKAYLNNTIGHDRVRSTHAYVQKYLPVIAKEAYARMDGGRSAHRKLASIKRLAREIEILAPACREGESRPDNSEYPWPDLRGNVLAPCMYDFPEIDPLRKDIRPLIRVIQFAAQRYL